MKNSAIQICLALGLFAPAAAEDAKVVFISGKPSHGPMAHEHRAGNMLLAKCLNEADLGIEAIVLSANGYPEDSSVLNDAATIVVFCTGHQGHLLNPHLDEFDALMKKGTGVVMIHWATEAKIGMPAKMFLEWMGGFCDLNWSVNPHWKPNFKTFPDHPVANGLTPFGVDDEWYYHMRFVGDLEGVTPILSDLPPPETLKRPDGTRSGNPDVRRAVEAGESQHVAWTYDRPDGKGRGFGFTGAHNHKSWKDDNFRKVLLNAIVWTANLQVPENGVESKTPTDEELKQNLDDKGKKPAPKPAAKKTDPPESVDFQQLRRDHVKELDSTKSLDLLAKALAATDDPAVQSALLRGMHGGLEGRRNVPAPKGWTALSAKFAESEHDEVRRISQELSQIFGVEEAAEKALALVADASATAGDRRAALRSLVAARNPKLASMLEKTIDDPTLQIDTIRAFAAIEDDHAPELLLSRYAKLNFQGKRAVIETLSSREGYATALLAALKDGRVPKADIPAYLARSLSKTLGEKFTAVFGDVSDLSKDKADLIANYKAMLTADKLEKADASRGRLVFQMACFACHNLYGEGGVIGPDLTGSNRADLDYILLNMIDPSADIPEAYKLMTIKTKDGQILAGTLAEEDDQRVVLNMVGLKQTVVKSDIASREVSPLSMMPEGLLPSLKNEQVLDLVKYLQTTKQVELPK
ncbi:MAG: putative heme-binding domain-containing protein [Verrucomicrobiales bacterium]|jgi:putative heme-binding domain-containing protein